VAQRKLTIESGQQIQAEYGDRIDDRQRHLEQQKILDHKRKNNCQHEACTG